VQNFTKIGPREPLHRAVRAGLYPVDGSNLQQLVTDSDDVFFNSRPLYYLTNIMFYTNCCRTLLTTHIHFAADGITTLLVIKLIQMSVILSLVYFTRICTEHYYV